MKLKTLALFAAAALAAASSMADEPLGSWLSNLNQHGDETWQTGKLSGIANRYKRRIAADQSDYEARVLHAATILLQLGENKNVAAYAKKLGFTIDYLGMEVTGSSSKPSTWPAVNTMVDTFVKEGVPVLKDALLDLEGIPSGWSGSVKISKDEFPVDDDVYVDMGDVLYARAGIEAAIGLAYFAHGYDLTLDYTKAINAFDYGPTVQTLKRAPVSESDDLWDSIADSADCGSRGVTSLKLGYFGKKMYIRMAGDIEDIVDDGYHAVRSIYLLMEDSSDEPRWGLLLTDDPDDSMQQGDGYVARVFTANDDWWRWNFPANRMVPVSMTQSGDAVQFEIDLSKFANYAKAGAWSVDWGEVRLYDEWIDGYYYSYWNYDWYSVKSPDDFPAQLYKLLTEQTKFMAKVRNQSSLPQSKSWMKAAFNHALMADAAVSARTDEDMHFVEYDPVDADAIDRARSLTEKALASLDAAQEVDVSCYLGEDVDIDLTLLPNDGVMQVYLGALFEGKITRDLLPTFQKGADEGPVPVMETVKDATFAGLLPEFTTLTWTEVIKGLGREVAHQTITIKLDANGGNTSEKSVSFDYDEEEEECLYPELPVPTKAGGIFAGWATAKTGGEIVREGDIYDAGLFAGAKAPTLYAQWIATYALTVKGEDVYAEWDWSDEQYMSLPQEALYGEYAYEVDEKGVVNVPEGAIVSVYAADSTEDNRGNDLVFQKWAVSSSKAVLGPDFHASYNDTYLVMPPEKLTLTATYIDESTCGTLCGYANVEKINLGYDEGIGDYVYLMPPQGSLEWSVDGGKNWYKADMYCDDYYYEGDYPLLKAGRYTVTWRSTDPQWTVTATKTTVDELYEGWSYYFGAPDLSFTPQIVIDVMACDRRGGTYIAVPSAGSVTLNPKDGFVPSGKTIALTAKASKDYAFQGWAFAKYWDDSRPVFSATSASWKLEDCAPVDCCGMSSLSYLTQYIDPVDKKVHVVAAFKALSAYSADDIDFWGFEGYESSSEVDDSGEVTVKAVVGCALDENYELVCSPLAGPLTYKLGGKLPDGLKFDAKTGILSGVPKKAGNTTVTITATDPGKNSKGLKVNFEVSALPTWLVGEYRGSVNSEGYHTNGYWEWDDAAQSYYWVGDYVPGRQEGVLELSVKSDGKVSAKIITRVGTRSVSGALTWYPSGEDESDDDGCFSFTAKMTKDEEECEVEFCSNGTITGYADSYFKTEDDWIGGEITGMRQDAELLAQSPFLEKYYTFAFSAETENDEETTTSGYGYLTIKTDKKGGAKVTGQLPDGEKVSMSALVMPFEGTWARLYLFASPSSYKKLDWFAMTLTIDQDGAIRSEDGAAWTPADFVGGRDPCSYSYQRQNAQVYGEGSLYSEAASLENYYWTVSCSYSDNVRQEYTYKKSYETMYEDAYASGFDGYLFNVSVKGDKKGAISLVEKSPAPWVQDGEWNYWEDKNGNDITDPSQLSISFTKATGIFTGKALVYFDEPKPTKATLPYSGVMIYNGKGYTGQGSAVHTYKYTYWDDNDRAKTATEKITLPVTLE